MKFRLINAILGIWIFASAFMWPHDPGHQASDIASGMLVTIFGLSGMYRREVRFLDAVVGAWLFTSGIFLIATHRATAWNEVIVGAVVFVISLVRGRSAAPAT